ncbi:hypothetical protein [Phenylobacterium immobile]|uniref:hypothetical protein n=1 Tax=Phenylobacterium immobile TaxID=21 RepID=UPI000A8F5C9F|nr:hypothetical protein [Phenylobacterium immobile]
MQEGVNPDGPISRLVLSDDVAVVRWIDGRGRALAGVEHGGEIALLTDATGDFSPALRVAVGEALAPLVPVMLAGLTADIDDPTVEGLATLPTAALELLFSLAPMGRFAAAPSRFPPEPERDIKVTLTTGDHYLAKDAFTALLASHLGARVPDWLIEGRVALDPLFVGSETISVSPIMLDAKRIFFICTERPSDQTYIVIARVAPSLIVAEAVVMDQGRYVFVPKVRRAPDRGPAVHDGLRELCLLVMQQGRRLRRWVNTTNKPLGLMLHNGDRAHLGHFIWNEMAALEHVATAVPGPAPLIYAPARAQDTQFYGPFEDLYPELAGRFLRVANEADAFRHALSGNVAILPCTARSALKASRARIQRVVTQDPDMALMAPAADAFQRDPKTGRRRPVVVFSLRLQNRTLPDPTAFFVDCAKALSARFGSVGIIFDGLNGMAGRPLGQSFRLHNADGGQGVDRGLSPMEREQKLVEDFKFRVAGLPIDTVSLVGATMRPNLLWMSRGDFFVAFQGAGLAKLRWALDLPGYVLTSEVNLTVCSHLRIYDDGHYMEPIDAPLILNGIEAVRDLRDRDEPRARVGIPYGDNFELVDPERTIGEIVEACAAQFAGADVRTPAFA